jgi:hypothetical protein
MWAVKRRPVGRSSVPASDPDARGVLRLPEEVRAARRAEGTSGVPDRLRAVDPAQRLARDDEMLFQVAANAPM